MRVKQVAVRAWCWPLWRGEMTSVSRIWPSSSSSRGRLSSCPFLQTSRCSTELSSNASTQRSEEHTSELQSRLHLVCRLLLEKKKNVLQESLTFWQMDCIWDPHVVRS